MREGYDGSILAVSRQLYDFGAISANESKRSRTRVRLELSTHIDIASGVGCSVDGASIYCSQALQHTSISACSCQGHTADVDASQVAAGTHVRANQWLSAVRERAISS